MSLLDGIRSVMVVVGCQRSGTTLTAQILGADKRVLMLDEWDGLYPWFNALLSNEAPAEDDLLARAATKYKPGHTRLAFGKLAPGVDILVLKAPNLTFAAKRLANLRALFPNLQAVRVVYPVRDPRAVTASMMRLNYIDFLGNQYRLMASEPGIAASYRREMAILADGTASPYTRFATLWRIKSEQGRVFYSSGLTPFQFRYEDLTANPGLVIAKLAGFCGLEPAELINPERVYAGMGPGETDRTRAVDTASAGRWRVTLNVHQSAEVLRAAGSLAREYGYE